MKPEDKFSRDIEANNLSAFGAEEWRPVPPSLVGSQEDIEASSWGRVRGKPYIWTTGTGGKVVRQIKPNYGSISKADKAGNYFRLRIKIRGMTYKVHRLVCGAFHGEPPKASAPFLHADDNGLNNAQSNLSWGTQKDNLSAPRFRALMAERAAGRERASGKFT